MSMPPFRALDTPRLQLRPFADDDLATLLAYRNDPDIARYQSWSSMTEAQGRAFIAEMQESRPVVPGAWFQFAIVLRARGAHIGDCALYTRDDPRLGEIGYTLAAAAQGRGYAREAVAALLDYAFQTLAMHRITATVDVLNVRSIALLEGLHFRREGHFIQCAWCKGGWCDEYVYAMLRATWQARATPPTQK